MMRNLTPFALCLSVAQVAVAHVAFAQAPGAKPPATNTTNTASPPSASSRDAAALRSGPPEVKALPATAAATPGSASGTQSIVAGTKAPLDTPLEGTPEAPVVPEDPRASALRAKKEQALVGYRVGTVDLAATDLRQSIVDCHGYGSEVCSNTLRAELYVALGIVLAGGKNQLSSAARLFHAALLLDPSLTVPRELATTPVQRAMAEANHSVQFTGLAAESNDGALRTESGKQNGEQSDEESPEADPVDDDESTPDHSRKRTFLFLHPLAGIGDGLSGPTSLLGAAGLFGGLPTPSPWAIAGRIRGGGVRYDDGDVAPLVGAALLMGVLGGQKDGSSFGYGLGGLGLDNFYGETAVSLQLIGGGSIGGLLIEVGLDAGAGSTDVFAFTTLGLGWGQRL